MKKRDKILFFIMFFISLMFAVNVNAAPINGLEQTLTQPDGTTITVHFYGDEFYSYMTDSDGNVVVKNSETGYYVYASLVNGEITATNYILEDEFLEDIYSEASILKADDIPQAIFTSAYENSDFYREFNTPELVSLDYEDKNFNGMDINNIVIFIKFRDREYMTTDLSVYDGMFNTGAMSLKSYYDETTYGKLGITSTFYPSPSPTGEISAYTVEYSSNRYNTQEDARNMFRTVLNSIKEQIPEGLDLDKNNDGKVDMITFVLPGNITNSNSAYWPHAWWFDSSNSVTINGLKAYRYNVQVEGSLLGIVNDDGNYTYQSAYAILAHETHHILGFPDMYYYNKNLGDNSVSLGEWDIMCASDGGHTPAYMKYRYGGWLDIPEIKENGTFTLNSLQDGGVCAYKLRSPYSADEYFIIEYRRKTTDNVYNFEDSIPSTGLVVYRVIAKKHGKGNYNANVSNGAADELRYLTAIQSGEYCPALLSGDNSGISLSAITTGGERASFTVSLEDNRYLAYFKDENLADAVASAIGKNKQNITDDDLKALRVLEIEGRETEQNYDLSGIEQLTGLHKLTLAGCGIDDISELQGLTNLSSLILINNHINDISALSNLTNLRTLKLRGNYIDDYSYVSSYYDNLTTKDFSLLDKNDAVFYIPDLANGVVGRGIIQSTNTIGEYLYYSLEKYDSVTNELLSRKRGRIYMLSASTPKYITIPEKISDEANTYVKLNIYENDTYRHLMSETIVNEIDLNLNGLN